MTPQTASTRLVPAVHQTEALTRLAAWFQQRHTPYAGTILVLPTGGGKTFTAVQFLAAPTGPLSQGYKVLWLAHTHHLLEQAYAGFHNRVGPIAPSRPQLTIRIVSGVIGHYRVAAITPGDDVVIAMLPTITRAYNNSSKQHPALEAFLDAAGEHLVVIFDEAHQAPAYSYRTLLTNLRQAHRAAT